MRFHCRCDTCKAQHKGDLRLWVGKRWERGYGERPADFRQRVLRWHKENAKSAKG